MEKKYNSLTEEGKALAMEFMSTVNGSVERKEIINYIRDHFSEREKLSMGVEAGIIKILATNGSIVPEGHGMYKLGNKAENLTLQDKVLNMMNSFQKDLERACTVNLLRVTEEDRKFIEKVGDISNQLLAYIWELEESKPETLENEEKELPTENKLEEKKDNPKEVEANKKK